MRASTLRLLAAAALAAAAFAATAPAAVPQQPAPAAAITGVDATAYPQLSVAVTVLDTAGVPVSGLPAAAFAAFEDGRPIQVAEVRDERLSLAVAIVIDTSGSMQGEPIAAAREAARQFIANLGPQDSAALFAFSDAVRTVVPFTNDRAQLTAGIDGLTAVGNTSLYEAAQAGVYATSAQEQPRLAVVLLSDGEDTAGGVEPGGTIDFAAASRIPVYTVGFGPAPATDYLQRLSAASAGQYRAATTGTVAAVYGDIAKLLDSQYTLTLRAPAPATAAAAATLRVTVDVAGQAAEATYPFDIPAPPEPTPDAAIDAAPAEDAEPSRAPLLAIGGVAGAVLLGVVVLGFAAVVQRTRTRRRQLAVVRPNLRQAEEQGLPAARASIVVDPEDGEGRLVALEGDAAGRAWDFASTPLRIGSGSECEVRVPVSAEVAPQHALIWMKDGKIMLRHTGGRRSTLVGGRGIEWLILDSGDEFSTGPHRWRAELR